eukprot:530617_1
MPFQMQYNQCNTISYERSKTSQSIKLKGKKASQRSLKIPLPEYIAFVHDDIDEQWRKLKSFDGPCTITMNDAITKTNKLKKIFKNKTVLQLSTGIETTSQIILNQKPKQITKTVESTTNITKYNNIDFVTGDWLYLKNKSLKTKLFDILICIPPFITINHSNNRYYIDELICNSWKYLNNNGYLIFIQSMPFIEQTIHKLKQNGYSHVNIVYGAKYNWKYSHSKDKIAKRIDTFYVIMAQLKKR